VDARAACRRPRGCACIVKERARTKVAGAAGRRKRCVTSGAIPTVRRLPRLASGAALAHPFVDVVPLGGVSTAHWKENLRARDIEVANLEDSVTRLASLGGGSAGASMGDARRAPVELTLL